LAIAASQACLPGAEAGAFVPLEVVEEGAGLPVVQGLEEVAGVPQEAWLIRSSEVLYKEVKLMTMGPGDDSKVGDDEDQGS
jgi:hypothetical protein